MRTARLLCAGCVWVLVLGCGGGEGGSPWTGDGVSNAESPAAVLRGLALFAAPLAIDDLVAEATSDSDTPVTPAGMRSVWYINRNPTPDDVTDKSGTDRSPAWANDARPGLWIAP